MSIKATPINESNIKDAIASYSSRTSYMKPSVEVKYQGTPREENTGYDGRVHGFEVPPEVEPGVMAEPAEIGAASAPENLSRGETRRARRQVSNSGTSRRVPPNAEDRDTSGLNTTVIPRSIFEPSGVWINENWLECNYRSRGNPFFVSTYVVLDFLLLMLKVDF